jgi:hypothetical protein
MQEAGDGTKDGIQAQSCSPRAVASNHRRERSERHTGRAGLVAWLARLMIRQRLRLERGA